MSPVHLRQSARQRHLSTGKAHSSFLLSLDNCHSLTQRNFPITEDKDVLKLLHGGGDGGNEGRAQNLLLLQNCYRKDSQNINDTVLASKG